jgi:general secretion pathway protein E
MMTIEDPVEYDLAGGGGIGGGGGGGGGGPGGSSVRQGLSISQTQVDPKKNVTFATGLRHILRQDPDVIMVGEIRDEETARIAVQASLTGHLVLSTLHTNDAAAAVVRLIDLNVEPFLVASSLAAVLAQRLVRKVHPECRGEGCTGCLGAGFKGRTGVFELLVLSPPLRDMVIRRANAMDIKAKAESLGMVSLRNAGAALVRAGLTTAAEVARVIESLEEIET